MPTKIEKIKAIQTHFGTVPDGIPGEHTWDVFYRGIFGDKVQYPYEGLFWGAKVILASPEQFNVDYHPGRNGVKTSNHKFAINGTFYDYATKKVCSLLGDRKGIYGTYAARSWAGYPETVLCYDGKRVKSKTAFYSTELADMEWFIGGIDLINLDPEREGFSRFTKDGKQYNYTDPLRTTYHSCIGVDKYGILHCFTAYGDVNKMARIAKNLLLTHCIMVDGGSPCSFNSPTLKYGHTKTINNLIYFE